MSAEAQFFASKTLHQYAGEDLDPGLPSLASICAARCGLSLRVKLLAINSADDERNPPESGLETAALKRVKNGKLYLIPASDETRGHLTTGTARFYSQQLQDLLSTAPKQAM
jgi:hypothetical protein